MNPVLGGNIYGLYLANVCDVVYFAPQEEHVFYCSLLFTGIKCVSLIWTIILCEMCVFFFSSIVYSTLSNSPLS